jgi:SAM-dependent methyltransferase
MTDLPFPPYEMRQLVGPTDEAAFDNPTGAPIFGERVPTGAYEAFFDFGCGCGREARQLIQQSPRPQRYVGVDLHRGMINWCQRNLAPTAPGFEFHHIDVYSLLFNPGEDKPWTVGFPAEDRAFSLVNATSVFTHLVESQAEFYLRECGRILRPDGILRTSWFLFDKVYFPYMSESSNALYVSYVDPVAAVLFDRGWVRRQAAALGLTIYAVSPPQFRGHQWELLMARTETGVTEATFPEDAAPTGIVVPPQVTERSVAEIGIEDATTENAPASPPTTSH